ncbi:hypothetical protein [Pseudomonas sp. C2B4]|uniref:hypothetical protein n=1 Tax=Pseudomonas sp. C2B4 TaxID=2735270 RepID=UPI001586F289|nr:hypothetical protein [Pseudomonas sp. C2B4]NUU36304.1 hypothetical protein [Pseudomonas sp. C2B4]
MHSQNLNLPVRSVAPLAGSRASHQAELKNSVEPNGEVDMEPRVAELETRLKCIRKDMEAVHSDVKSIKHRLAYAAGGAAVVLGLLGWIANSRFDQLVTLLLAH